MWSKVTVSLLVVVLCAESGHSCTSSSVDCKVSHWGDWGSCSVSCGGGRQTRRKSVLRPPSGGGDRCPDNMSESRHCNKMRCPIDCEWGPWGAWGECTNIGRNTRSRARNVTQPAMYGGMWCVGPTTTTSGCEPSNVKRNETKCPDGHRLCRDGWTCIREALVCNGDDDCTDNSDEINCTQVVSPCDKKGQLSTIPNIDATEIGFDILKNKAIGRVLDNRRYNGKCQIQRRGDDKTVFRLPSNVQMYRFESAVETGFESRTYESAKNLVKEEKKSFNRNFDFGISVLIDKIFSLGGKVVYNNDDRHRIIRKQNTKRDTKYFKIKSSVQVASFRIARDDLILTDKFRKRETRLPSHYDYAKYLEIIDDFGTHYYTSGVIGGQYEHTFLYDRSELNESDLTEDQQVKCLEAEITLKLTKGNRSADGNLGYKQCTNNSLSSENGGSFMNAASRVISVVKGGSAATAGKLSFSNKEAPETGVYDKWVESVHHYPEVIEFELAPISHVFKSARKRENMERALYEYMRRFDPSNCPEKCPHGSTVLVNEGKECQCLCKAGFTGLSCMEKGTCWARLYNKPWHALM